MPQSYYLASWVTKGTKSPPLGTLPIGAYITAVHLQVGQAFNSDGSDNISVGYTGATEAYATSTIVSTTGVKSPTLGSDVGYQSIARELKAYYTAGGTAPTEGKALVVVEYFLVPKQP